MRSTGQIRWGVALTAIAVSSLHAASLFTLDVSGNFLNDGPISCSQTSSSYASCDISIGYPPFNISDPWALGSYAASNPSVLGEPPGIAGVFASSASSVSRGNLQGDVSASFSDTLLFTGGSGAGMAGFNLEYSLNVFGGACAVDCIGNAKVTFNDFSMVYPFGPGQATLFYPFTYGTPFPINMTAVAHTSALFFETGPHAFASITLDSVVVIPEPAALGLFPGLSLALWIALRTSARSRRSVVGNPALGPPVGEHQSQPQVV